MLGGEVHNHNVRGCKHTITNCASICMQLPILPIIIVGTRVIMIIVGLESSSSSLGLDFESSSLGLESSLLGLNSSWLWLGLESSSSSLGLESSSLGLESSWLWWDSSHLHHRWDSSHHHWDSSHHDYGGMLISASWCWGLWPAPRCPNWINGHI